MTDEEMKAMSNDKTDNKFKNQLCIFVKTYLKMKDAFVATDDKNQFLPKFKHVSIIALLLTLILLFVFHGNIIVENPLIILLAVT